LGEWGNWKLIELRKITIQESISRGYSEGYIYTQFWLSSTANVVQWFIVFLPL
jgi:hypothetical protein